MHAPSSGSESDPPPGSGPAVNSANRNEPPPPSELEEADHPLRPIDSSNIVKSEVSESTPGLPGSDFGTTPCLPGTHHTPGVIFSRTPQSPLSGNPPLPSYLCFHAVKLSGDLVSCPLGQMVAGAVNADRPPTIKTLDQLTEADRKDLESRFGGKPGDVGLRWSWEERCYRLARAGKRGATDSEKKDLSSNAIKSNTEPNTKSDSSPKAEGSNTDDDASVRDNVPQATSSDETTTSPYDSPSSSRDRTNKVTGSPEFDLSTTFSSPDDRLVDDDGNGDT
jgi:hypothetical protein